MNYPLFYRIGFHPWEDAADDDAFVARISELFAREEQGRERPFGRALDLGTGSGIWAVELAKRGWQVTGVDIVEQALQRAYRRVDNAGVDVKLVRGDATALRTAGIGSGYRLVLDTGIFHGLERGKQLAMGREVDAVAGPEATVLMYIWARRWRPFNRGASRSDIEAAFPRWKVTAVEPTGFHLPKALDWLLKPDDRWYTLRRR